MLARRFTIVCLTLTIFGMVLASFVAEAGRRDGWARSQMSISCELITGVRCARN